MFCYVFAFIANFGILARQRSQLIPFVLIIAALPIGEKAQRKVTNFRQNRSEAEVEEEAPVNGPKWQQNSAGLNVITRPLPPPTGRTR